FAQSPRLLSPNLFALRSRLRSTRVQKIFALHCASHHYSTYREASSPALVQRDSMDNEPDENILAIFQWILAGTGRDIPLEVCAEETARQSAGSGSCGIAALNFIESEIDEEVAQWTDSTSHLFRRRGIRDLVVFHITASTLGFDSVS
ncbi:hypothetical protein B0H11DRAFT_1715707, partial [Mycena galericulata]